MDSRETLTCLAGLLLRLPPSSTYVRNLQDFVLREANLIRIVWVGFVRVYCLCTVRVFCRGCNVVSWVMMFGGHSAYRCCCVWCLVWW